MNSLKNYIRIVALLTVIYCFYGIWQIYNVQQSLDDTKQATVTLVSGALNFDNYDENGYNPTIEPASKNFINTSSNFWFGMLSLSRSLPVLILAIISGLYFIFDPLAINLRDFIKYSLKIPF
ncbi:MULTISPECIES: hypothetical protein [Lysinibacillus]|uniref:hypothetical protein n=1 Tax=Lysinibacillus TaxID=400634 RepID=UPI002896E45F|nr:MULTISPECIES: hypothetical protein [Lysinibacillus]MED3799966.1 hypothetical protein [Lysinibacillus capsici]